MKIQFEIIRSQGAEHLCYRADGMYVDVSNPMVAFTDEDEFEIVKQDESLLRKEYEYNGSKVRLVPEFYGNGWPALTLKMAEDGELYTVLSINLKKWMPSVCRTAPLSIPATTRRRWSFL